MRRIRSDEKRRQDRETARLSDVNKRQPKMPPNFWSGFMGAPHLKRKKS